MSRSSISFSFAAGFRDGQRGYDLEDKGNHLRLRDPMGVGSLTLAHACAATFPSALWAIQATNGTAPDATQSFSVGVVADQPPVAIMNRPYPGEIVSGPNAECFGDGVDDVGCTQARFLVDNVVASTDSNTGNHYHFGGAHLLWNTTLLTNGAHTLRMTVTDTAGQTGSTDVEVIVANGITPLEGWRLAKFTEAELSNNAISGNEADPDFDGLANLMEYALGLDPKQAAVGALLPAVYTEHIGGLNYLAMRYRRPMNGRPGLAYVHQVGGDLLAWASGAAATTLVAVTPNSDGTETVSVRDNDRAYRQVFHRLPEVQAPFDKRTRYEACHDAWE